MKERSFIGSIGILLYVVLSLIDRSIKVALFYMVISFESLEKALDLH